MKKCIVLGLIFGMLLLCPMSFAEDDAVSTQGVEINQNITKTIKQQSKQEKKELKQQKKTRKQYLKNIAIIEKLKESKRIKQRDLDFFNSRLQIKESRLEEIEKGDNK